MDDFVPSIKVTFYLTGDEFSLEKATKMIGVIPTETRTKDDWPPGGLVCTLWCIEIKEEYCIAISILFERLLDILDGKTKILNNLCKEYNLKTSFEVVIHMKDGDSPEVVLPRKVVSFAAAIDAEIDFDLYCYE